MTTQLVAQARTLWGVGGRLLTITPSDRCIIEAALGKPGDSVTLGRRNNVGKASGWWEHLGKGENGSVLGEGLEWGWAGVWGDPFWPAENFTLVPPALGTCEASSADH